MFTRTIVAVVLLAAACQARVTVRHKTRGGTKVEMGQRKPDPAKERQKLREAGAKKIAEARAKLTEKKWGQARMILDRARMLAADESQAQTIGSLYVQIDRQGQQELALAKQAYEQGQYLKAIAQFEQIRNTFGWLPSGKAAGEAIRQGQTDPAAMAAIQESKARRLNKLIEEILKAHRVTSRPAEKPTSQPASAPSRVGQIRKLPIAKQARVVDLLERIAASCALAPGGRRAADELRQLRADKAFSEKLAAFGRAQGQVRSQQRPNVSRRRHAQESRRVLPAGRPSIPRHGPGHRGEGTIGDARIAG